MKKINIIVLFLLLLLVFLYIVKKEERIYNSTFIIYEGKKTEFIASNVYEDFFLVKNIPLNDISLKRTIEIFIKQKYNHTKQEKTVDFYKYTNGTGYFLDDKEHDGGPTSYIFLSNYDKENIATFIISKCKKDTTKLVGRFHFYGNGGLVSGKREIDTLIYYCK